MSDATALEFTDFAGETLVKGPGSIQGESFLLRDLSDCSVFLLDYTSEVEVTNCTNCLIFIGPVDGPAIFNACSNCQVAVACQQFQAKACTNISFGLYCATGPTLSNCSAIKVACWSGAYPGLTAHFAAANINPNQNQWNKVYDASAPEDQDSPPNFEMSTEPAAPWVVPIEGEQTEPENPVPGPDGAPQHIPPTGADNDTAAAEAEAVETLTAGVQAANLGVEEEDQFIDAPAAAASQPAENGDRSQTAAEAAADFQVAPPATEAARDRLQQRLAAQAREEAEKKAALQASASQYLSEFYDSRNKAKEERIKAGRDEMARRGSGEIGPDGNTQWERAISMIDFNMSRPSGSDLSRFKAVLLACKEKA